MGQPGQMFPGQKRKAAATRQLDLRHSEMLLGKDGELWARRSTRTEQQREMVLLRALEPQRSAALMLTDKGLEECWQHHGSKSTSSRQHKMQVAASSPASGLGLLVKTTWQRKGGKTKEKRQIQEI